ncbi:hypothetical protein D8803_08910 [Streptococcus oralis]|uniref:Uncharacterized protein n=1 Tax=Streptococcus oralis TaxID=1303 RepID=A0A428FJH4_STROR|nr:hypothetical protein [Streptococcus oralis]RSJ61179.1 hypothetical protein D8803_08910 [Streptococcus oralis]
MILERIIKSFEFQRKGIHGPVPLWGVLNGIFILYPIAFFMFMAGGLEVLKNEDLYQGLLITGIVVWVLNLVFLLDLKRGILTSFGSYLMYLTGHVYAILSFSAMSGDYSFIGLKIFLPLIFSIIMNIVMSWMVDLDSEEILSDKAVKNVYNFLFGPPMFLSLCCVFLAIIGYEYFWGWGMSLFFMIMGPYLYRTWFYIIYAYQHRHDVEEETSIKHIKVNPDMISNREFDRDRFSRKVTKDD